MAPKKAKTGGERQLELRQMAPDIRAYFQTHDTAATMKRFGINRESTLYNLIITGEPDQELSGDMPVDLAHLQRSLQWHREYVEERLSRHDLKVELATETRREEVRVVKELIDQVNGFIHYISQNVAAIIMEQSIEPFLKQLLAGKGQDDIMQFLDPKKVQVVTEPDFFNKDDITYRVRQTSPDEETSEDDDDPSIRRPAEVAEPEPGALSSGDHSGEVPL